MHDVVDNGAIRGCVFEHEDAIFVDVYAKMHVAQASAGVVDEDKVAPGSVSAECEALQRTFDLRRQPQCNGKVPVVWRVGSEPLRGIFRGVVELQEVSILPTHNILGIFFRYPRHFVAGVVGLR